MLSQGQVRARVTCQNEQELRSQTVGNPKWVIWEPEAEVEFGVQKGSNTCERKREEEGLARRRSEPVMQTDKASASPVACSGAKLLVRGVPRWKHRARPGYHCLAQLLAGGHP